MIGYLEGTVISKNSTSIIVLNQGIGYEVVVPPNRLFGYQLEEKVQLYTYLHVREDALQLFGFGNSEEKEFFLLLLNVSGVGPKGALGIIGQSTLATLQHAIANENVTFLTKAPGIGKKTAQRLVLELKDKMPKITIPSDELFAPEEPVVIEEPAKHDIYEVLKVLGYQEREITKIYPQLIALGELDEQTMIKKALQLLAKV